MKVLVVGNACREHAIVQALLEDKTVSTIYTLPERVSLKETRDVPSSFLQDKEALISYLKKEAVDLAIIGPEQPLVEGLSDFLRSKGMKVFGPSSQAAQLEGSKIFAKQFMKETEDTNSFLSHCDQCFGNFTIIRKLFSALCSQSGWSGWRQRKFSYVKIKPSWKKKADSFFEKKALGPSGDKAILEDFQSGQEISVFVITNGESYNFLPVAPRL